jgi:hypothetical protein
MTKGIRRQFKPEIEEFDSASKWWLQPPSRIIEHADLFMNEIDEVSMRAFTAPFPPAEQKTGGNDT